MSNTRYVYAVGRRKTASAQVRLYEGTGESKINGRPVSDYFGRSDLFSVIFAPFKAVKQSKDAFYIDVMVRWSGDASQAGAIAHAISRALVEKDVALKPLLKQEGLLTRDARKVERKKPGHHKARKSIQWSKR